MFNIQPSNQILKQAKHLRQIARHISRSLGPGSPSLNSLPERLIQVHPEVVEALVRRKPIVALESTIITHGMPYPENIRYCKIYSVSEASYGQFYMLKNIMAILL